MMTTEEATPAPETFHLRDELDALNAEAPATNAHAEFTIDGSHYTCKAPDCGYAMFHHGLDNHPAFRGQPDKQTNYWADLWQRSHADQYGPGRAPDIAVDWEISACCSVCEDGIGKVAMVDSETIACEECNTTWSMDGTSGERSEGDQ